MVNGEEQVLEFEVSGMLRRSDMVMADHLTQSWWQQLTGEALVGSLTNTQLKIIPSLVISVEAFFEAYPAGRMLSPSTNRRSESRYGFNPYHKYDESDAPYERFFDADMVDARLPPFERVVDLEGERGYKIYPFSALAKEWVINDVFDGMEVVLFYEENPVSVLDEEVISQSKDVGAASMFSARLDGRLLEFEKKKGKFTDMETRSSWDITGRCIDGPLEGSQLTTLPHSNHFAFAFLAFHPDCVIYEP